MKNLPWLIKQAKPWFGMPFRTYSQEAEWILHKTLPVSNC